MRAGEPGRVPCSLAPEDTDVKRGAIFLAALLIASGVAMALLNGNYLSLFCGAVIGVGWIVVTFVGTLLVPQDKVHKNNRAFWLIFVTPAAVLLLAGIVVSPRMSDRA